MQDGFKIRDMKRMVLPVRVDSPCDPGYVFYVDHGGKESYFEVSIGESFDRAFPSGAQSGIQRAVAALHDAGFLPGTGQEEPVCLGLVVADGRPSLIQFDISGQRVRTLPLPPEKPAPPGPRVL